MSNGEPMSASVYPHQIAFNVLPQIGSLKPQMPGYTSEEAKMLFETRKILGDDGIRVSATCVRVPVFYGHAEAINVEFATPVSPEEAREVLAEAPGVTVVDDVSSRATRCRWIAPARTMCWSAASAGRERGERPGPVRGRRQHPQGRGAERRADRGSADRLSACALRAKPDSEKSTSKINTRIGHRKGRGCPAFLPRTAGRSKACLTPHVAQPAISRAAPEGCITHAVGLAWCFRRLEEDHITLVQRAVAASRPGYPRPELVVAS